MPRKKVRTKRGMSQVSIVDREHQVGTEGGPRGAGVGAGDTGGEGLAAETVGTGGSSAGGGSLAGATEERPMHQGTPLTMTCVR